MTKTPIDEDVPAPYTGVENLEVMREAENYNRYLLALVTQHAAGAKRVIDFGAGSGTFAVPCAAAGFDVTAVEPDERLRALLGRGRIRAVAAVEALPDEAFEYAYTLNVLEHIPDDVAALRALRDKLVAGGRLFVYVPAFPVLFTSMDAKVRHVRRYTRATMQAALARQPVSRSRRSATPIRSASPRRWFSRRSTTAEAISIDACCASTIESSFRRAWCSTRWRTVGSARICSRSRGKPERRDGRLRR